MDIFKRTPRRTFFFVSAIVLFLSFYLNIFGVGYSQDWFTSFQQDSAEIVEKAAQCRGSDLPSGPIVVKDRKDYGQMQLGNTSCSSATFRPYYSQFGLQSRIMTFFAPHNTEKLPGYFSLVEAVLGLCTAVVFALFLVKVRDMFGKDVGWMVLMAVALSVWVVAYARNVYWIACIMFLPFIFSFVGYRYFQRRGWMTYFYIILGIIMLLKFLDGYEHITTVIVSALVPIVFYQMYDNRKKLLDCWRQALLVFIAGVAAFGVALVINTAALVGYYKTPAAAFAEVMGRAEDRSAAGIKATQQYVVPGFEATSPYIYKDLNQYLNLDALKEGKANPIKYAVISAFNYMLLPAITVPFVLQEPFGSILQSVACVLIISLLSLIALKRKAKTTKERNLLNALRAAFYVGFLGSISWLILMPAHAYPHAHLNGIIFYMPTLLIGYIIVSYYISRILLKGRYAK